MMSIPLPISVIAKMSPEDKNKYMASLDPDIRARIEDRIKSSNLNVEMLDTTPSVGGYLKGQANKVEPGSPDIPSDDTDAIEEQIEKWKGRLGTLAGVGATMVDAANMAEPANTKVGVGAGAGAVQGAVAGGAMGPVGMIGGAIVGGLTGAFKSAEQKEEYEMEEARRRKEQLSGLRTAPLMRERGGLAASESGMTEDILLQTEEGEILLLPDGRLVDAMADKTHKEIKDRMHVTDVVPDPTFVFSNSDKEVIDLSKYADDIFKHTKGVYSEDGNTPMQVIKVGDILGKKGKVTPAALVKRRVRRLFPIIEKPREDFEVRTNQENLRRRGEVLQLIMRIQEGVYEPLTFEAPEFMEQGGFPGSPSLNKLLKLSPQARTEYLANLPEDQRTILNERLRSHQQHIGLGDMTDKVNTALDGASGSGGGWTDGPSDSRGGWTDGPSGSGGPDVEIDSPYDGANPLDRVDPILKQQRKGVDSTYETLMGEAEGQFSKQRMRNLGSLASKIIGSARQDSTTEPARISDRYIDGMFPTIQESEINEQIQRMRRRTNRAMRLISDGGVSASRLGSAMSPFLGATTDAEGDIRSRGLTFNKQQAGRTAQERKKVLDHNMVEEANARNSTRTNRNLMAADQTEAVSDFMEGQGSLENAMAERRSQLMKWREDSKQNISNSEFEKIIRDDEREMKKKWFEQNKKMIEKSINDLIGNFTI